MGIVWCFCFYKHIPVSLLITIFLKHKISSPCNNLTSTIARAVVKDEQGINISIHLYSYFYVSNFMINRTSYTDVNNCILGIQFVINKTFLYLHKFV